MNGMHTRIAAGLTLVALGGFAGYAVNGSASNAPARSSNAAATQPVQIRTQTIRRTVRVVKHEKPKHPPAAAATPAPGVAPRVAAAAPASRPATAVAAAPPAPAPARVSVTRSPTVAPRSAPVRTRSSGSTTHHATTPAVTHRPVKTRSSGSTGGKSGGGEHEGGGDD